MWVVSYGLRGNATEPQFRGSCDHVMLMPVEAATSQAFTLVVVLPGKKAQF